jgi:hypothetical protein
MIGTDLEKLYSEYLNFNDTKVGEYDILAVASVMMAQALSIYKTVLSENDYNTIVDNMSDNRAKIKKFEGSILQ